MRTKKKVAEPDPIVPVPNELIDQLFASKYFIEQLNQHLTDNLEVDVEVTNSGLYSPPDTVHVEVQLKLNNDIFSSRSGSVNVDCGKSSDW
jgi:TPP-dependent pyruvate/acetoin dehydrogenase alpha subunit